MIAADQNSRVCNGLTLDAVNHPSCAGCSFYNAPRGDCMADHPTLCTNSAREDGRSIIWVARKPAENPATVAADILRTQGEDVDAASVKRAEAVREDRAPFDAMQAYLDSEVERLVQLHHDRDSAGLLTGNGSENLQGADEPPAPTDWVDAFSIIFDDPAYASLGRILTRAYAQAATGKGAERHGQGQPFEDQPMQDLIRLYGVGFALGQAAKKSQESMRLPTKGRKVAELLGAIVYISGAIISIEQDE